MMRRTLSLVLTASVLLVPLTAIARNTDDMFRLCEQQAANNREQRTLDSTRVYHANWQNLLEERRERYFDSWGIENDRDRANVQRDIDKDINDRLRGQDSQNRDDLRNIKNDFRNDDKNCQNEYRDRQNQVPVGQLCYSSDDCGNALGMCTVETGECRAVCQPGTDPCIQVCSGRCRLRS